MEIKAIKNPQSEELVKLLKEKAETPLTPEEKEAQIISWVLGGIALLRRMKKLNMR